MRSITMNMIRLISHYPKILFFTLLTQSSIVLTQEPDDDSLALELDLDAMWENTVWEEIQDVTDVGYEVEKVTPVAGVRGAEAEDEALAFLYYRRSMKGLTLLDMQKAYGKLKLKRDNIYKQDPDNPDIIKLDSYMLQLKKRMI